MNVETVREYCLNKKGVTESFPFDDVSLVVKVMNKMFALIDLEEDQSHRIECDRKKRSNYANIIQELKELIILIKNTGTVFVLRVT